MYSITFARGCFAALLLFTPFACATDDDADDTAADGSDSTTAGEGLEIAGEWVDDFMGGHSITDTQWVQTFGADSFTYTIDHYDNDGDVLVAQSDDDMTWSRFDWTNATDGKVYYCQTAFMLGSAAEADATARADDSMPAMGGCGMFPWSALNPG